MLRGAGGRLEMAKRQVVTSKGAGKGEMKARKASQLVEDWSSHLVLRKKTMPVLSEDSGLHETLALLTSQLRPDSNHKEEMVFLKDIFSERSLSYLMKVIEELQTSPMNNDEKELLQLLSTPHLRLCSWPRMTLAAILTSLDVRALLRGYGFNPAFLKRITDSVTLI
uniref:MAGUK p55 sub member 3 n=1 Tax=Sphaerodactylus townsendi TaxID=933632 RepID=A0ACB8EUT6_9SAUR